MELFLLDLLLLNLMDEAYKLVNKINSFKGNIKYEDLIENN